MERLCEFTEDYAKRLEVVGSESPYLQKSFDSVLPQATMDSQIFDEIGFFNDANAASHHERSLQVLHIMRNLSMFEGNAIYFAKSVPARKTIVRFLHLGPNCGLTELRQYSLEILENISRFIQLSGKNDSHSQVLTTILTEENDRGSLLSALSSIVSLYTVDVNVTLIPILPKMIHRLACLLFLPDYDLISNTLDYFYAVTAISSEQAIKTLSLMPKGFNLIRVLVQFLTWGETGEDFLFHHNWNFGPPIPLLIKSSPTKIMPYSPLISPPSVFSLTNSLERDESREGNLKVSQWYVS